VLYAFTSAQTINHPVTVSVSYPSSCLEGSNNFITEFFACAGVCDMTTDETLGLLELLRLGIMVRLRLGVVLGLVLVVDLYN